MAHLHATDLAIERLNGFRAEIGGELQCPRCWVAQGVNSPLIATPSDDDTDWLKCRICNSEYEVSG